MRRRVKDMLISDVDWTMSIFLKFNLNPNQFHLDGCKTTQESHDIPRACSG